VIRGGTTTSTVATPGTGTETTGAGFTIWPNGLDRRARMHRLLVRRGAFRLARGALQEVRQRLAGRLALGGAGFRVRDHALQLMHARHDRIRWRPARRIRRRGREGHDEEEGAQGMHR
jgi:hypothetical protein